MKHTVDLDAEQLKPNLAQRDREVARGGRRAGLRLCDHRGLDLLAELVELRVPAVCHRQALVAGPDFHDIHRDLVAIRLGVVRVANLDLPLRLRLRRAAPASAPHGPSGRYPGRLRGGHLLEHGHLVIFDRGVDRFLLRREHWCLPAGHGLLQQVHHLVLLNSPRKSPAGVACRRRRR